MVATGSSPALRALAGTSLGCHKPLARGKGGKQLELLKEVIPKTLAVAVLRNPTQPVAEVFLKETQARRPYVKSEASIP